MLSNTLLKLVCAQFAAVVPKTRVIIAPYKRSTDGLVVESWYIKIECGNRYCSVFKTDVTPTAQGALVAGWNRSEIREFLVGDLAHVLDLTDIEVWEVCNDEIERRVNIRDMHTI